MKLWKSTAIGAVAGGIVGTIAGSFLNKRKLSKGEPVDFEFGNTKAALAFLKRNRNLLPTFERLLDLGNKCFGKKFQPKNRAEDISFGLGHTCREDFLEIVFLAANGYSNAALKLLRGLYERAVALEYIVKKPDKAERFTNFAAIQEHRSMEAALKLVTEAEFDQHMGAGQTAADIRQRYKQIKPEFSRPLSWDLDIPSMVHTLGEPFTKLYLICYSVPNFSIHATLASAARWEDRGNTESEADFVVRNAMWVFILVLDSQSKLFGLNIEKETADCWNEAMRPPAQHEGY